MHLRDEKLRLLCLAPFDKDENGRPVVHNPDNLPLLLSDDATDEQLAQAHLALNDRWLRQPFDPKKTHQRNMAMRAKLHAALFNIEYGRLYANGFYPAIAPAPVPAVVLSPAIVEGAKILRLPLPVEEKAAALLCAPDGDFDKDEEKYAPLSFFNGNGFTIFRSTYKKAGETLSIMFNSSVVQRTKSVVQSAYQNVLRK